jgi:putative endonuclease
MSSNHIEKGATGESAAARLLESTGYKVLHQNWRAGKLEIDIIAENQHSLIFVEVKTRSGNQYGSPLIAVDKAKQKNIIRGAHIFLQSYQGNKEPRFDVICVTGIGNNTNCEHIEGAFWPTF